MRGKRSGQLGEGPGLLDGLQSDPRLKGCRISLVRAFHDAPRNAKVIFDQFNISSGPVLGVHLISRFAINVNNFLQGGESPDVTFKTLNAYLGLISVNELAVLQAYR